MIKARIFCVISLGVLTPAIFAADSPGKSADLRCQSSPVVTSHMFLHMDKRSREIAPDGAAGSNRLYESGQADQWFIEEQRAGEDMVVGGIATGNADAIQAGLRAYDWGFKRQAQDGGFSGTGDPFHSTSFFVEAVSHSLLLLNESPYREQFAGVIHQDTEKIHRAARWMIVPAAWDKGTQRNKPYTHRRYLVAAALGLAYRLTGDNDILSKAHEALKDGLSLQQTDGVNPEKGGHDSSYQAVGVYYAEQWLAWLPSDDLSPRVERMVRRALEWELTRIDDSGKISSEGNTRTGLSQEKNRSGKFKQVGPGPQLRAITWWAAYKSDQKYAGLSDRIQEYYRAHPNK